MTTHESNVARQFGPRAAAYVTSAVHAEGPDLVHIAKLAEAHGPARALDLGCGGGHVAFALAPHAGQVTAYDLSDSMLAVVKAEAARRGLANVVTRQGSVEAIDLPAGSFELIATRFSAHHWHNVAAGLAEARRLLAPGGVAVFVDTITPGAPLIDTHLQAIELLRDPSHVRNYSVAEWRAMLEAAGFTPEEPTIRSLRLDFATWIARMATPEVNTRAIRALQNAIPQPVADYLKLEADGSFTIEAMTMVAR